MFNLLGTLAALMSSVVGGAGQQVDRHPIQLEIEGAGAGVRVRVVGSSETAYAATFSLEVISGGNRSLHRGSATLRRGEIVTLSTVTIGNAAPGQWRADLNVEPQDGQAYQQVRTSA